MAEWLKAHAWKACLLERVTWVRIPLSPPYFFGAVVTMVYKPYRSFSQIYLQKRHNRSERNSGASSSLDHPCCKNA